jgi:hypothetical protein
VLLGMSYKSALVVQTLKKVGRENTDDHIINKLRSKAISNVYFFMLGNESQQKVKGFSEKEKIGNIEFKASENLITVDKVLNRAKDDLNLNDALDVLFDGVILILF